MNCSRSQANKFTKAFPVKHFSRYFSSPVNFSTPYMNSGKLAAIDSLSDLTKKLSQKNLEEVVGRAE